MTAKLQITNLEIFLETLQHCCEQVTLIGLPDRCCDLRTNTLMQDKLRSSFKSNEDVLSLTLLVYSQQDYFQLLNSCIH